MRGRGRQNTSRPGGGRPSTGAGSRRRGDRPLAHRKKKNKGRLALSAYTRVVGPRGAAAQSGDPSRQGRRDGGWVRGENKDAAGRPRPAVAAPRPPQVVGRGPGAPPPGGPLPPGVTAATGARGARRAAPPPHGCVRGQGDSRGERGGGRGGRGRGKLRPRCHVRRCRLAIAAVGPAPAAAYVNRRAPVAGARWPVTRPLPPLHRGGRVPRPVGPPPQRAACPTAALPPPDAPRPAARPRRPATVGLAGIARGAGYKGNAHSKHNQVWSRGGEVPS